MTQPMLFHIVFLIEDSIFHFLAWLWI